MSETDDNNKSDDAAKPADPTPASEAKTADVAADATPLDADAKPAADANPADAPAAATAKPAVTKSPATRKPSDRDAWDEVGRWVAKHGALPALGLITIAIACIHWHILGGEPAGDDLSFHFGESARIADCLRHFDFDLWNPSANAGYASAYYYQVLPQLASALPAAIFGHLQFFFSLSVILPLVFAPACAYRGMRLMGATPWQSAIAAFVIGFMNGESRWGAGNAGTFQVGLYTQTWALCMFPLALGHGARWMRDAKGLAPAIAWGGASFLCHPFAGISLGVALVIAFLVRFVAEWRIWQSPTMIGVIVLYIGGAPFVLLCALAVMPVGPGASPAAIVATAGIAAIGGALVFRFHATDTHWRDPRVRGVEGELHRLAILGVCLMLTTAPVLLPLVFDREGFGGFPHRVGDEIGPGFGGLWAWYKSGSILDFMPKDFGRRLPLLTYGFPVVFVYTLIKRSPVMRWLWPAGVLYAVWLGLGPHAGKIGDDLIPAVRALGAMQIVIGMGIGAGPSCSVKSCGTRRGINGSAARTRSRSHPARCPRSSTAFARCSPRSPRRCSCSSRIPAAARCSRASTRCATTPSART